MSLSYVLTSSVPAFSRATARIEIALRAQHANALAADRHPWRLDSRCVRGRVNQASHAFVKPDAIEHAVHHDGLESVGSVEQETATSLHAFIDADPCLPQGADDAMAVRLRRQNDGGMSSPEAGGDESAEPIDHDSIVGVEEDLVAVMVGREDAAHEAPALKHRIDRRHEILVTSQLVQVPSGTQAQRLADDVGIEFVADEEHLRLWSDSRKLPRDVESAQAWQAEVEQNDLRLERFGFFDRGPAVRYLKRLSRRAPGKQAADEPAKWLVIVDDQNPRGCVHDRSQDWTGSPRISSSIALTSTDAEGSGRRGLLFEIGHRRADGAKSEQSGFLVHAFHECEVKES
jgi:hypothetical protein